MSNYTLIKLDADPDKREWSAGHFCVKKDDNSVALFLFDYPEARYKLNCTEAEALAAAKSFMAIDDLMWIASTIAKMNEGEGLTPNALDVLIHQSKYALEKAGIK